MKSKITIKIEAFPEDITPEKAQQISGYAPDFAESVRKAQKKSEAPWGWCSVRVTVKRKKGQRKGRGEAWLGQCSYQNEQDFIENSGYFYDLVKEAISKT